MSKVRTQIYLTEEQHQMLTDLSRRKRTSLAEMIRQAVNQYLEGISPNEALNPLSKIIALRESGCAWGSVKHDEEIYGE